MSNPRTVLAITGSDREHFLQGLITNDVTKANGGIIYAALLTPQGKYLADFFVIGQEARYLIDVDTALAAALAQRLAMYKLRADVSIEPTDIIVSRGTGDAPEGAYLDPRSPALGWRYYGATDCSVATDWNALNTEHAIPEFGQELGPDSYILEMGFERLNGVDFRKGCYVGQEVTARMKHKTELRKGLSKVRISGNANAGTQIMCEDREVGTLLRVAGDLGLAYLRFDRADGEMQAGGATLLRDE